MRKKVKTAKGLSTQSEKKNASSRILLMNSAVINSFYSSKRGLGTALFLMTIHHWDNGVAPLQRHAIRQLISCNLKERRRQLLLDDIVLFLSIFTGYNNKEPRWITIFKSGSNLSSIFTITLFDSNRSLLYLHTEDTVAEIVEMTKVELSMI
jgi:hypothetical protein